ncbi:hypothetical protein SEVIR_1G198250v4 [Setaria viridis]
MRPACGADVSSSNAALTWSYSRSIRRRYTSSYRICCYRHFSPSIGRPTIAAGGSSPIGAAPPPMLSIARTISLNSTARIGYSAVLPPVTAPRQAAPVGSRAGGCP